MAVPNVTQITSTLRNMPDQQLQQYAAMHKADPYILSLAVAESNDRKAVRASQQAQMAGQKPPTVVDQDLMGMAPQQLPEQQGIGALKAPNMQNMADGGIAGYSDTPEQLAYSNEPVIRMAGGGVAHFRDGGLNDYIPQIVAEAKRLGIDPQVAINLFKTESAGNKNAVSDKGAAGLGQLMVPAAKEMGLSEEERFDPQKNIPASLGYFKKQLDRFGSYDKAAAAYNWGPGNVNKHLTKNEGVLNRLSLPKETANYLTKLMPGRDANAGELPGQAAPQAQATKEKSATGSGIAGLANSAPASPYTDVQGGDNDLPSAIMNAKANNPEGPSQMPYWDQMKNAFGFVGSIPSKVIGAGIDKVMGFDNLTAAGKLKASDMNNAASEADDASFGPISRPEVKPTVQGPTASTAPTAPTAEAPAEKKSRFNDDDLLMLGLGMMANNKPGTGNKIGDLLAGAGQAGIGAIAAKREREKSDIAEQLKRLELQQAGKYQQGSLDVAKDKLDIMRDAYGIKDKQILAKYAQQAESNLVKSDPLWSTYADAIKQQKVQSAMRNLLSADPNFAHLASGIGFSATPNAPLVRTLEKDAE